MSGKAGSAANSTSGTEPLGPLERLTELLVGRRDPAGVACRAADALLGPLRLDLVALLVTDDGWVELVAAHGPLGGERGEGAMRDAIARQDALVRPAAYDDGRARFHDAGRPRPPLAAALDAATVAVVPLPHPDGWPRGLLVAARARPVPWTTEDRRTLIAAGRVLSAAIEQTYEGEIARRASAEADALAALSHLIEAEADPHELRARAREAVQPRLRGASITFAAVRNGRVRFDADLEALGAAARASLGGSDLLERVLAGADGVFIDDLNPGEAPAPLGALALVPVRAGLGAEVLVASRPAPSRPWSRYERRLLQAAARAVGVAVERAEAADHLREARRRAEFLSALSDALLGADTVDAVARAALPRLGPALRADHMAFVRLDEFGTRVSSAWGDAVPAASALNAAIRAGRAGRARYEVLESAGVAVAAEPVPDPSGEPAAVLCAVRHASAGLWRVEERELLARAAATAGVALERASTREELEEKNRQLERGTAEVERFVHSVSHDLKAPLVSLEGMSMLLAESFDGGDRDDAAFYIDRLRANTARLTALVNDLLEFSRLGHADDADAEVPVAAAVSRALAEHDATLRSRGFTVQQPAAWPVVLFPERRLDEVFSRLIANAVKHMPSARRGPRLSVSWQDAPGSVEFRVTDNGAGVPVEHREHVFELFARLNPSAGGTGAGLTLVRRVVEAHGGRVWLEDGPGGQGVTAAFSLPATRLVLE